MSLHPGIENNPVKCVATCFLVFRHQLFCFSRDFFQHPNQSPKSCTQTRSQDANFGWHVETVKTRMAFGAKTRTELHFGGKMTRLKKLQPLLTLLPSLKVHIQKFENKCVKYCRAVVNDLVVKLNKKVRGGMACSGSNFTRMKTGDRQFLGTCACTSMFPNQS